MIIAFVLIPPSNFDFHRPGQWKLMYPGYQNRDYAQNLQVVNGIIPQMDRATWQIYQGASTVQYINKNTPQESFNVGDIITGTSATPATGVILTDDGVFISFQDTSTGGADWNLETGFTSSGVNALINTYMPGAAVLPPNAYLPSPLPSFYPYFSPGAIPQHAWISDALGTDLGAIMFCPNSYTIGISGLGGFLNPDYQKVGDYSDITGSTLYSGTDANAGIWYFALQTSLANGNVVIYNGQHYVVSDSTRFNSDPPNLNLEPTGAYILLDKSLGVNQGYIVEWDIIEYDFANDWLQFRSDKRGNEFRFSKLTNDNVFHYPNSAINLFQWGNDSWFDNKINESVIDQPNSFGAIYSNTLEQGSIINLNTLDPDSSIYGNTLNCQSQLSNNTLKSTSSITANVLDCFCLINENILNGAAIQSNSLNASEVNINNNSLGAAAFISANSLASGTRISHNTIADLGVIGNNSFTGNGTLQFKTLSVFINNIVSLAIDQTETYSGPVQDKRAESGFSNFEVTIDITSMTTLTIPTSNIYCGIINLTSTNATETINKISDLPRDFPFTLYPANGLKVTITGTPILSPPLVGDIVLPTASITIDGSKSEWIKLQIDRVPPSSVGYSLQIESGTYI